MYEFYAWVSLLTQEMGNRLMTQMITKGYAVGPLAASGEPFTIGIGTTVLALTLQHSQEKKTLDVLRDLKACLKDLGASYNMAVVSDSAIGCTWSAGEHQEAPTPTTVKTSIDRIIDEDDS